MVYILCLHVQLYALTVHMLALSKEDDVGLPARLRVYVNKYFIYAVADLPTEVRWSEAFATGTLLLSL